jgi:hypothetical protein
MTAPQENIKLFDIRPVEAVAGLVPGGRHCGPILEALPTWGIDTASVGVFHGAEGVTILNPKPHGVGHRILRFFESWGYQAEIMKLYDEGLRKGESMIVVPLSYSERDDIGRLLVQNHGHAVYYFGIGRAESLTAP